MKKLTIEDIDKANEEAKEKEMRGLIEKKREETKKADLAKKHNFPMRFCKLAKVDLALEGRDLRSRTYLF